MGAQRKLTQAALSKPATVGPDLVSARLINEKEKIDAFIMDEKGRLEDNQRMLIGVERDYKLAKEKLDEAKTLFKKFINLWYVFNKQKLKDLEDEEARLDNRRRTLQKLIANGKD